MECAACENSYREHGLLLEHLSAQMISVHDNLRFTRPEISFLSERQLGLIIRSTLVARPVCGVLCIESTISSPTQKLASTL